MLGDSRSSVNFLGGSHMPGLNTQGLAHFHGLWFQWRSNFKALMVLFWSAWLISRLRPPLVPAGWPESPGLPDRGQMPVLAGNPLPWALGQGGESQAWNHFYAFGHKETWVWSLIQGDPTSTEQLSPWTRTTEPLQQTPGTTTTESTYRHYWSPQEPGARAPQQEKPPQWEALTHN